MRPLRLSFVIAVLLAFSSPSLAQSGVRLGSLGYGGTGCPEGTAAVRLSSDGKSVSLRFTRYAVSAGGGTGRSFDRKSCSIAIPMNVPAGKRVSIVSVELRSQTSLPPSAKLQFTVESFVPGGRGPVLTRAFTGPRSGNFVVPLKPRSAAWSNCGADVTLRSNSSLRVSTAKGRLASASVSSGITYRLQWGDC